jgi:hypothetical protein
MYSTSDICLFVGICFFMPSIAIYLLYRLFKHPKGPFLYTTSGELTTVPKDINEFLNNSV